MSGPVTARNAPRLPNTRQAWDAYDLDHIWEMLRDENGIDSFRQVTAWYRMAYLCTDQADQLDKALAQLMHRWPPNPGSAAQAFQLSVQDLILSMRDSAAAAKANEAPLIRITSLISDAKDAILALIQQRTATAKAETDWNAKPKYQFAPIPPPEIEPGWRDALDHRARDIMFATDQAIGQAAANFRTPTPFSPSVSGDERHVLKTGDSFLKTVPVPVLDPPPPSMVGVSNDSILPNNDVSGPVTLDGSMLSLPTMDADVGGLGSTGTFIETPSGRVLAPGGVIGGGAVDGSGSRVGSGQTPGVVGPGATGMPGMVAPPIGRGAAGATGSSSATKIGGRRRRRSDPSDSWVPPVGGPSILEPAPEPDYFDPGPNVIGLDR